MPVLGTDTCTISFQLSKNLTLNVVYIDKIENNGTEIKISPINYSNVSNEDVEKISNGLDEGNIAIVKRYAEDLILLTYSNERSGKIANKAVKVLFESADYHIVTDKHTADDKLAIKLVIESWSEKAKEYLVVAN